MTSEVTEIAGQFATTPIITISNITDGSVNYTYRVETEAGPFILQAISPVFTRDIIKNYQTVLPHLVRAAIPVPALLLTTAGENTIPGQDRWYRALSLLPGKTVHDSVTSTMATSAGALVGRFHRALADIDVFLTEPIAHFHDTSRYFTTLQHARNTCVDEAKRTGLKTLCEQIQSAYQSHTQQVFDLPRRVIHGDLKITNILFDEDENACGLIDLDTLMHHTIAIEMGDALRSWSQVAGEDRSEQVFDQEVYTAALEGYFSEALFLTDDERMAIPWGVGLVTLELAARFLTDAYEEDYFTLSPTYESLYEQNMQRAANQLAFYNVLLEQQLFTV